jgi:hypothetical protein
MSLNEKVFDAYSIAHFSVGVGFSMAEVPPGWAVGSHVVWEAIEDPIVKRHFPDWFPDTTGDGMGNHIGDLVSFSAGYFLMEALRGTRFAMPVAMASIAAGAAVWVTSPDW